MPHHQAHVSGESSHIARLTSVWWLTPPDNWTAGARRGVLNLPGVEEDVGLIGIHWRGRFIELVPWNGLVRCMPATHIHASWGYIS